MAPKKPLLVDLFRKTIESGGLVRPGERILIAFSGGPDSTALLSLFLAVRSDLRLKLALAHYNHRLRPAAREDEAFARQTAKKLNLPIAVGSGNVRARAARNKMNLEEAGRELRYAFFKKAAKKLRADKIATGHTADDQAETVLMRLLRGTGLRGLGGIRPLAEGGVIRPLLGIERKDIARWLAARRLDFRTDESNLDLRFFRNRIRHEVLPLLTRIEPKVVSHMGRLAMILQDEEDLRAGLEGERGGLLGEKERGGGAEGGGQSLDAESLSRLPKALARRAVRGFLARLVGSTRGFTFNDIEAVLSLAEGKVLTLRGGLSLCRDKGLIAVKPSAVVKVRFRYLWDAQGILAIKETGLAIRGRIMDFRGKLPAPFDDRTSAFFDAEKLAFPLLVRNREEGDRFHPFGAPGSKKLKEILRAKRIPVRERDRLPVLLTGTRSKTRNSKRPSRIVWIPGLPAGDAFKVGRATKKILWIEKMD